MNIGNSKQIKGNIREEKETNEHTENHKQNR